MKITEIKVVKASRFLYCQIYTDEGIVGLGESGAWGFQESVAEAINLFANYLKGKNPLTIEHHWQYMYRFSHFRGATIMAAISAIDIALWDISGKYFNAPIYELLGGPTRDKVRVYSQISGQTEEDLLRNSIKSLDEGYTAIGHLNPFLDEPRDTPYKDNYSQMLKRAVRVVGNIRDAVGDEVDLCLELHRRLEPGEAIALSKKLEPFNIMFLEDPIRPDNMDAMAQVSSRSSIPIATGERLNNLFDFQMLLNREAAHYLRPSIGLCGGITGIKKIAVLAEANHCSIIPHNPLSPVATHAVLQACAAIENVAIAESPDPNTMSAADKFLGNKSTLSQKDMVTHIPVFEKGYLLIPDQPGLGVHLIEDIEEKFPYKAHQVSTRLNLDGSICDQ